MLCFPFPVETKVRLNNNIKTVRRPQFGFDHLYFSAEHYAHMSMVSIRISTYAQMIISQTVISIQFSSKLFSLSMELDEQIITRRKQRTSNFNKYESKSISFFSHS